MSKTNWVRESLPKLQNAAEKGIVSARIELAKRYLTGRDVSRDPKEGFNWISAAAESNNAEALLILGWCYATGTGISASGRKAYDTFVKAALRDNAGAVYNLGVCYEYGMGVNRDWGMAQGLYEKSAKMGYTRAKHVVVAKLWNKDTDDTSSERRDAGLSWFHHSAQRRISHR